MTQPTAQRQPGPAQSPQRRDGTAAAARSGLRESDVRLLELLASGHDNRLIARSLHIHERSIPRRLNRIYGKIGASTRAHAVALAIRAGVIQ